MFIKGLPVDGAEDLTALWSETSDFFTDLGGSSIDYFVLLDTLKSHFSFDLAKAKEEKLSTPLAFYNFIKG